MFIMMSTKTLLGKYLKDCTPEEFLGRQYVIVSLNIRCTDNFKQYCVSLRGLLPNGNSVMDYNNMRSKENYKVYRNEYRSTLMEAEYIIGTLIQAMYGGSHPYDVVLLCTPMDKKQGYMDILAKFIEKRFAVPCVWYKEYREHKPKELTESEIEAALERADASVIDHGRKEFVSKFNTSGRTRMDYFGHLSMDDKIKVLKAMNMYEKGMRRKDVDEVIEDKFG